MGVVRGVIAADLKLDKFSEFVSAHRPGEHGVVIIFDSFGALIAHPEFARLVDYAMMHPSHAQLPAIRDIKNGLTPAVIQGWNGSDHYEGNIRDEGGRDYLFRLQKFSHSNQFSGYSLLLAAEDDFVQNVRKLQVQGLILALLAGGCFAPLVSIFGSRMSTSLKRITTQASKLRSLTAPDEPVASRVKEIHELGKTMAVAQRSIWSFARFVPRDIVRGIVDGSIST